MLKIIFERLSDWKRLPNYQLERRLDIFISMYVKELLEEKLWPLSEVIIPEFPISRKTLGETIGINQTVKVDYVLFPKDFSENKGCDNAQLNRIYNAFNCFITTTTAEGWGLTVTEAMATKTLVICPKHTSLTEITNNGDLTLNFMFLQTNVFVNDFEKIRYTCNPNEVNTLLGVAYNLINDEEELQIMVAEKIQRAYDKVKGMTWENVAKQFKVKIDKLAK